MGLGTPGTQEIQDRQAPLRRSRAPQARRKQAQQVLQAPLRRSQALQARRKRAQQVLQAPLRRSHRRVANGRNRSYKPPFDGHRPYKPVPNRRNRSDRPPFERYRSHRSVAHWRNRSDGSVANRPHRCPRPAWPKRALWPACVSLTYARQRLGASWDLADFDEWEHHAAGDRLPERARDH